MAFGIKTRLKKKLHRWSLERRRCRCTANYASGKVALGERHGTQLPDDWIRVDWSRADFTINLAETPQLPFATGSQHLLYSAHMIEHLPFKSLVRLLRECHRVLRPGGRIRLECPDSAKLHGLYRARDPHMLQHFSRYRRDVLVGRFGYPEHYLEDHLSLLGEFSNYIVPGQGVHVPVYAPPDVFEEKFAQLGIDELGEWGLSLQTPDQRRSGGHQSILYFEKLKGALEAAGFEAVTRADFGRTTIPQLMLNGGPAGIREKPHRRFYSLYVEATNSNPFQNSCCTDQESTP